MEKLQSLHKSLLTPHNLSPTHVPVLDKEEVPRVEDLSAEYDFSVAWSRTVWPVRVGKNKIRSF